MHLKPLFAATVFTLFATAGAFGQTYEVLHTFGTSGTAPRSPSAYLIQASDGNFYGTTVNGGDYGAGTVFKMTPTGTFSVVASIPEGYAETGVVEGNDGNFYGTTSNGGTNGYGSVFKVTPAGTFTILYSFANYGLNGNAPDGAEPFTGLVKGDDGNFYGTTWIGGNQDYGTVFKITPAGTLTTLAALQRPLATSASARGGLIQASDGKLYGTSADNEGEPGSVFTVTTNGLLTTLAVLSYIVDPAYGSLPMGSLVEGSDGNFYGTTWSGPAYFGWDGGTVFKMTPSGTLTTFAYLTGFNGDEPTVGLAAGNDGNLYGSANKVFRVGATGTITPLTTNIAAGKLVKATDGNFYGTSGAGYIFKLTPPTGVPVITANPQSYGFPLGGQTNVTLTVSAMGSGTLSYQWYAGLSGNTSVPLTGETNASYSTPVLSAPTNYWVRVSNENGHENSTDTFIWYTAWLDEDSDGYGNPAEPRFSNNNFGGVAHNNTDCDDASAFVHPGRPEISNNSVDDDCDGFVDERFWYYDSDGDGYGDSTITVEAVSPPSGYVANIDCNDSDISIHPGATETCNGIDDDCDGLTDEGATTVFYRDADGDTYGNPSLTTNACSVPAGYAANDTDCNDSNSSIHPAAAEAANGLDDDCDGQIDEGFVPTFVTQLQSQTVFLKGDALFSAQVAGVAPFNYQWRKNGVKISKATNSTLSLLNVITSAAAGYTVVVSNAVGVATSSVANLTIEMDFSGAVAAAGKYNGLFFETNSVKHHSSGFITVTLKTNATFTGKLITEGDSPGFTGKMATDGTAIATVKRTMLQKSNLTLSLLFDLTGESDVLTGSVSGLTWTSPLGADRDVWYKSQPATEYTNYHTMLLPGFTSSSEGPSGYGYGSVTVKTNGNVMLVGGLTADGQKLSQTVAISKDGLWPFYAQHYPVRRIFTNLTVTNVTKVITNRAYYLGSSLGWLRFTNNAPTGSVSSVKTSWTNSVYPNGFTNTATVLGSLYTPPATGTRAINLTAGTISLSGGNLSSTLSRNFSLSTANKLTITPTANTVMLTVTPRTGLVKGSFIHPVTSNKTSIAGMILQQQQIAGGHFLGTNQAGKFLLGN